MKCLWAAPLLLLLCSPAWCGIEVSGDEIHISQDPNFESKLELKKFERAKKEVGLKETGYIVANAQTSYENEKFVDKWVSLDPVTLKNNGIELAGVNPSKGLAYGVITTSEDYEKQIKVGQKVRINRYGIARDSFKGDVVGIRQRRGEIIQVYFLAHNAEELIAGTTCEVEISHIRVVPYVVSLLSLLHLGDEDYILIKKRDGVYSPKHVTILDQDHDSAVVVVPVSSDVPYIARGAILLKPLIYKIVAPLLDKYD